MSEADPIREDVLVAESRLDADDHLKSAFVREVLDAADAGEHEQVRALVSPLHPADIADLFEQARPDQRKDLADALNQAKGTHLTEADIQAAMQAAFKARLDAAVTAGRLTRAQAARNDVSYLVVLAYREFESWFVISARCRI